ncbi:hypothetical protein AYK59_14645 [Pseudomonas synxantha]|uniref:Uncharacterized protein n=1 Tax=Pseudomonas libanensis TaxID=75588 RepID=A0A0R2Y034_9PSED|nr:MULTISPECIES: hypothetical protein [Pseudomonas]AMS21312.1 hypothetical protein AYK59_14645 [Pseudomonas synxantha]KRP41717.1 hypothetical protein TU73_25465 [Pseudomonas libanensis]MBV4481470.1 hypothetical protein [Pseudomonas khavaziana]WDG44429.1 hypothetical protein PUP72_10670 [Pseudomonas synxantha]SDK84786.1 hypothetical protein SAMN04490190_1927 [Pseudomonas libanensis]
MKTKNIKVIIKNEHKEVTVKYDPRKLIMKFSEADNFKKVYEGHDLYICFAKIRADFPHITFLCKGAKINVKPSRMASQMSAGLVAYEMTLGQQATNDDIVHLFDYEEENLTNDPQEQIDFFRKWLVSLGAQDYEKFN